MTFAPLDAEYLTLAANGVLTDYRILTLGSMLLAVDGGPTGPYTLNVDPTAIDHGDLDQLTAGNPHTQYLLGTILSANGALLTRVAGSPAALAIGSAGQVLTVSGGLPSWAAPSTSYTLLNSSPSEVLVGNTTTPTAIFSFSIPGGTMAAGDKLRLVLNADILNNSGASRAANLSISLGGTDIYKSAIATSTANANRRSSLINIEIAVRNQNPNIRANLSWWQSNTSAPTTGISTLGTAVTYYDGVGDLNVTLANTMTLAVTWEWTSSAANMEYRGRGATLELIKA